MRPKLARDIDGVWKNEASRSISSTKALSLQSYWANEPKTTSKSASNREVCLFFGIVVWRAESRINKPKYILYTNDSGDSPGRMFPDFFCYFLLFIRYGCTRCRGAKNDKSCQRSADDNHGARTVFTINTLSLIMLRCVWNPLKRAIIWKPLPRRHIDTIRRRTPISETGEETELNKEAYERTELDMIWFRTDDVIVTSGENPDDAYEGERAWFNIPLWIKTGSVLKWAQTLSL